MITRFHQYVLRFDVSVADTFRVDVCDGSHKLFKDVHDELFVKRLLLHMMLEDKFLQVSKPRELNFIEELLTLPRTSLSEDSVDR